MDRLRIIRANPQTGRDVLVDLATATVAPLRDSFTITRGQKQRQMVPVQNRYGGQRVAAERNDNATVKVSLAVHAAATQDAAIALMSNVLYELEQVDAGRFLEWRPYGATRSVYYELRGSADFDPKYRWVSFAQAAYLVFDVAFPCAPLVIGDRMDASDQFYLDSITAGDWSVDTGNAATLISGGGYLACTSTTTKRLRWNRDGGYLLGDEQVTARIDTGASVASPLSFRVCSSMDATGADTYVCAALDGTNLRIYTRTAGADTQRATIAFGLAAATRYWLRLRAVGSVVIAEAFTGMLAPTPGQTPAATTSYAGTMLVLAPFTRGHAGIVITPNTGAERIGAFSVEPFTQTLLQAPDELRFAGRLYGDVPALVDVAITTFPGPTNAPNWAAIAWARRGLPWNYVTNGDFEIHAADWSAAATPLTNAATSVARDTTAARVKYGTADLAIVAPATINAGATYTIRRRALRGRTYVALGWLSSAAGTTIARMALGTGTDNTFEPAFALTTTPTLHAVVWQPSADREEFWVSPQIGTGTATTFSADGVCVFEAAPGVCAAATSSATSIAMLAIPDEWDNYADGGFLAVAPLTRELVYVQAFNRAAGTITILRGREQTTAAAISAGDWITPVPALAQFRGAGAQPPLGAIDTLADEPNDRYGYVPSAAGGYERIGALVQKFTQSGAGVAMSAHYIDPSLVAADDFTLGEVAIVVYARCALPGTNPITMILYAAPDTAVSSGGGYLANFGNGVHSEEFGSAGKTLTAVTANYRWYKLGTLRLPVDRSNPARWKLVARFSWPAGSGVAAVDTLWTAPVASFARGKTGVATSGTLPPFIQSAAETTKIVRSDLSGLIAKPPGVFAPDQGLGGALIEPPAGSVDWAILLSETAPDDPSTALSANTPRMPCAVSLRVTPRWAVLRDA